MDDYKTSKQDFVSGTNGSSLAHINALSAVPFCSLILYYSLFSHSSTTPSLPTSWAILVLPPLLSMTLFAHHPLLLSISLLFSTLALHHYRRKREEEEPPLSPASIRRSTSRSRGPTPTPSRSASRSNSFEGSSALRLGSIGSKLDIDSTQVDTNTHLSGNGNHDEGEGRQGRGVEEGLRVAPLPALTVYRAHMLLMTFLAILAVDFPIFPRSLAKCESFGVSLMDLGVGSFVFSQGVVSAIPLLKNPTHLVSPLIPKIIRTARKVAPLFLLGLIRLISVKGTDYPEHESEYGTHWNFFFTLAVIPMLESVLHPLLIRLPISLAAFLVTLLHQSALSYTDLQVFTLTAPRTGLVSANKEGIVSLVGYLAIHLLGLSVGTMILPPSPSDFRKLQQQLTTVPTTRRKKDMARKDEKEKERRQDDKTAIELFAYAVLWWTVLGVCYLSNTGGWVSRRLANLPYVIWTAAYNTSALLIYLLLDLYFSPAPGPPSLGFGSLPSDLNRLHPSSASPRQEATVFAQAESERRKAPALFEAVNKNGLVLFLVANVATGLVNLSVRTMYAGNGKALAVLCVYSFGLCAVAWGARGRRLVRL